MNQHLSQLRQRLPALDPILPQVATFYECLQACFRTGHRVYLCGNGGSAADCEHWAGELLKGFYRRRPLPVSDQVRLPADLAEGLQGSLPVIPLTGFLGLSTAFANDVRPEFIFAQLVWALGQPGDVLIGISTSGNSRNVCLALQAARVRGMVGLGLTGQDGGQVKDLADHSVRAPAVETHLIQELHLPIYHTICLMLEDEFFGEAN